MKLSVPWFLSLLLLHNILFPLLLWHNILCLFKKLLQWLLTESLCTLDDVVIWWVLVHTVPIWLMKILFFLRSMIPSSIAWFRTFLRNPAVSNLSFAISDLMLILLNALIMMFTFQSMAVLHIMWAYTTPRTPNIKHLFNDWVLVPIPRLPPII